MDERELHRILQSSETHGLKSRGWRCPDENQLTRYVTGQLEKAKRTALDAHLADCSSCLGTIAFLAKAADWPETTPAPAVLVSRARSLVKPRANVWPWRWAMATAALACAIIVVGIISWRLRSNDAGPSNTGALVAQQQQPEPVAIQSSSQTPSSVSAVPRSVPRPRPTQLLAPMTRGSTDEFTPALLSPREGAVVRAEKVEFVWQPVENAISYEVKVTDAEGSSVLAESTTVPRFHATQIRPGKYFVKVMAHLPDGRTVQSSRVGFIVAASSAN